MTGKLFLCAGKGLGGMVEFKVVPKEFMLLKFSDLVLHIQDKGGDTVVGR
jgi:hypothetical protein